MEPQAPTPDNYPGAARGLTGLAPINERAGTDANLVDHFTDRELEKIATSCSRDYEADLESRRPRMKRLAEFQGLYASVMKAKNFPWTDAANVNLPILTYPLLQVQGRLYDMLWPANGKVIHCAATSEADVSRANYAEMFANAYVRQQMPEMSQGLDDTLHQVCAYGSAFRRTYWNEYEERAASDWVPIADFVVMDTQRSQDPSMRDVPRYSLVQRLNRYELEAWAARGIYRNVEKISWGDPEKPPETAFEAQLRKIDGITETDADSTDDKARMVIEQHRTLKLPDQRGKNADMDGTAHAVMVTFDAESKQIFRIVVREEGDPRDYARYDRQAKEHGQFTEAMGAFEQADQAFRAATQVSPELAGVPAMTDPGAAQMPIVRPLPPPAPKWLQFDDDGNPQPPKPQRRRQVCFFTHFKAFPSEGFYGIGFGDLLIGLCKAVNTLVNQHIDGVTLRNAKGGFISSSLKGQRGKLRIAPGELQEVDAPMGAIKDGIAWLDPPQNDVTTMPLVQMLIEAGDKLVASSDLMSGQTSGANRTAKETQILAEQMMMQITVLARRMIEARQHEFDKLWRIWGVFLPDEEIVNLVDSDGIARELTIGKGLFRPDARVTPAADPRTKTQRIEEAMTVYGVVTTNEYLMKGPTAPQLMRAVTEDVLRAHGAEKLLKLMPPPPPPPQPPQPMPAEEEDASFLQNKPHPVTPGDDDMDHAMKHKRFRETPAGQAMTKEQREGHEQHERDHHAQFIRKSMQRGQIGPPPIPPMIGPRPMPQMGPPQQ